jgi:hypothetical protein
MCRAAPKRTVELVGVVDLPPDGTAVLTPAIGFGERATVARIRLPCRVRGRVPRSTPLGRTRFSMPGNPDLIPGGLSLAGPLQFQARLFDAPRPRVAEIMSLTIYSSAYSFPGSLKLRDWRTGNFTGVPSPSQYSTIPGASTWARHPYSCTVWPPELYVKLPEGLVEILVEPHSRGGRGDQMPDLDMNAEFVEIDPEVPE